jgi:transposase
MKKLQETLKWNGIPFIEVDPAYTSKCCPNCFNIDNENRKYKKFECTVCNHRDDADHNASINIENRAFDKDLHSIVEKYKYNTKKRHFEIRKLFEVRHKIWLMKNTVSKKSTVVAA